MKTECERIIQGSLHKKVTARENLERRGLHGVEMRFEMNENTFKKLRKNDDLLTYPVEGTRTFFGLKILINNELQNDQINVLGVLA